MCKVEVLSDVSNSKFGFVTVNILAGKSTESTRGSVVIGEVNFSIFQFEFFFFFLRNFTTVHQVKAQRDY